MKSYKNKRPTINKKISADFIINILVLSISFIIVILFTIALYYFEKPANNKYPAYMYILGLFFFTFGFFSLMKEILVTIFNFIFWITQKTIYCYLVLKDTPRIFISFITKYYPFSLLFLNNIYHNGYNNEICILDAIFICSLKSRKIFYVESVSRDNNFVTIIGGFRKNKRKYSVKRIIHKVEKFLKIPKDSIYIRRISKDNLRFLIPREYKFTFIPIYKRKNSSKMFL